MKFCSAHVALLVTVAVLVGVMVRIGGGFVVKSGTARSKQNCAWS